MGYNTNIRKDCTKQRRNNKMMIYESWEEFEKFGHLHSGRFMIDP